MDKKTVVKNVIFSVLAQLVSVLVSLITGLVVPKFIPELHYSYWQMYVLYVGYVGLLHFGILDGIILKYSQYDYTQLNRPLIRSVFFVVLTISFIFSGTGLIVSCFLEDRIAQTILVFVSLGVITKNVFTFSCYLLQTTNRIKKYSLIVVLHRLVYGFFVVALLIFGIKNFVFYCIADLIGDVMAIIVCLFFSKDIYFGKPIKILTALKEAFSCLCAGFLLLIANFSNNLILGFAKTITQVSWGELLFGKVSFAFSIANLFLGFVTAISVVLFPSLKRTKKEELPSLYSEINENISIVMVFVLILYFPGCFFIRRWLPNYSNSLPFLGILLPIIIYSTKTSLLLNNYLKAYRKEIILLIVNLLSLLTALGLYLVCAFILNSLQMLLLSCCIIVMIRSIILELIVNRLMGLKKAKTMYMEIFASFAFIACSYYLSSLKGFTVYFLLAIILLILNKKSLNIFKIRRNIG